MSQAREIIGDRGDNALTLRSLAQAENTSTSAIYSLFGGREQLIEAVVGEAMRVFITQVAGTLVSEEPPRVRVHEFALAYLAFAREHPGLYRVLFVRPRPAEITDVGDEAQQFFQSLLELLGDAIGLPAEDATTAEAAVSMWLELHGIVALPPSHPRFPWPSDHELVKRLVRRTLDPPSGEAPSR